MITHPSYSAWAHVSAYICTQHTINCTLDCTWIGDTHTIRPLVKVQLFSRGQCVCLLCCTTTYFPCLKQLHEVACQALSSDWVCLCRCGILLSDGASTEEPAAAAAAPHLCSHQAPWRAEAGANWQHCQSTHHLWPFRPSQKGKSEVPVGFTCAETHECNGLSWTTSCVLTSGCTLTPSCFNATA